MGKKTAVLRAVCTSLILLGGLRAGAGGTVQSASAGLQEVQRPGIADVLYEIIERDGVQAALAHYRELRANSPEPFDSHVRELLGLGRRLLDEGRVQESIEIFRLDIEFFPEARTLHHYLGEAYTRAGQYELARQSFRRVLEVRPDLAITRDYLNKVYVIEHYTKHEYRIEMRDGVRLFTQVYVPLDRSHDYPILLFRTPYRVNPLGVEKYNYRGLLGPDLPFAQEGYIFAYQDVRGTFMSEGEFVQMRPIGAGDGGIDESTDTYDTIEWLIENIPNNNGRVGMWGVSYPGVYAAMSLVRHHPALKAVSPQAPAADWFMGDDWHHNGAFFLLQSIAWMRANGAYRPEPIDHSPPRIFSYPTPYLYDWLLSLGPLTTITDDYFKGAAPFWLDMMEHGTYDRFWQSRNILPHLRDVDAAVLNVGGWFDTEDLYGTLKTYESIEDNNPGIDNVLVMGPWHHGGWTFFGHTSELLGNIDVGAASSGRYFRETIELPFFNHYLKGKGEYEMAEMLAYETGSNQWRHYRQWPPADAERRNLYLQANGGLAWSARSGEGDVYEEYVSDPARPVPYMPSPIDGWSNGWIPSDQRFAARRPDVLVFQTEELEADLTIAGPIWAELFVSTSGTDADWVVKVIDVYPPDAPRNPQDTWMGDYQMLVRGEVMRGKFRNSFEVPEPFVPGEVAMVRFEMQDINHCFRAGHRIMVQVQSSWFPLVDRNPQTFRDIYSASDEDFQEATHRVYLSADHPSRIEVLIVER